MAMEYAAALSSMHKGVSPGTGPSGSWMPLSMTRTGEKVWVESIRGNDDTKRFLRNLGFVEDAPVSVVSELGGNVIVEVKGTRVAISKAMAARILTISREEGKQ